MTGPGLVLVDKPIGPTSHDIVARVRRLAGTRRVGHAGTLDPGATGLLILGVEGATRLLTYFSGLDKTYLATFRLGRETTTDDAEGEPLGPEVAVTAEVMSRVPAGVSALTGPIRQIPSSVSAVHVDGRRAYELVRAGEPVELEARPVEIKRFDVLARRGTELDVIVECSAGTYIRALARDLGRSLGVGAHVTRLRRTKVGPFDVREAVALEAPLHILPAAEAAGRLFPLVQVDEQAAKALAQGRRPPVAGGDAETAAAVAPDGRLIGLVAIEGGVARVRMNLPA